LKAALAIVDSNPAVRAAKQLDAEPVEHTRDSCHSPFEIPYWNFIVCGQSESVGTACMLPTHLRGLIYPESAEPVTSQSPDDDEFVWLGSVHSLVFAKTSSDLLTRLELVTLISIMYSGVFDELLELSSRACSKSHADCSSLSLDTIIKREEDVRRRLHMLLSPTNTFIRKHRVFGECIYYHWHFDQIIKEVDFELRTQRMREERRMQRDQAIASRVTNAILLTTALLTLASVLNDAVSLIRLLGWP
jgi:hypothetical protein